MESTDPSNHAAALLGPTLHLRMHPKWEYPQTGPNGILAA